MGSLENHVIVGNVGALPETTTFDSGSSVCKFRMAVNRTYKEEETTTWYTVEAWGKLGEICQRYISVGSEVGVIGERLSVYAFINKENEPQASLQLTARDVRFLGSKSDSPVEAQADDGDKIPW
jgi:single-strand DNA-binding protein